MKARSTRVNGAVGLILLAGCNPTDPVPRVRSIALPPPGQSEPAFEPHLSIDPGDPDRIVIAAHYGIGYNRGGRRIWTWYTRDGGSTWTGADMPLPNDAAALAADAVTAFDETGTAYLTYLFADTAGLRFDGGAALTRDQNRSGGFGPARLIVPGGLELGGAIDKGWIVASRGRVYLSWHRNMPDFTTGEVASSFWVVASEDAGETFGEPVWVADAFHGQVGVRPNGTVDVIFSPRDQPVLLHAKSTDHARSFTSPDTVARFGPTLPTGAGALDVPHLLVRDDSLLVCWSQARGQNALAYAVWCSASSDGGPWEQPLEVEPGLPDSASIGFPVTASSPDGYWLLGYRAEGDTTRVLLYRSVDGGRTWQVAHELARRPGGAGRFCLAAGAPCRKAEDGVFFPGDYFGLDATKQRIAAAYVLPDTDDASGRPTVFVSLILP